MKNDLIMITSIPIIFTIGIFAFFIFLPQELITITNFIGYASSLSTVIMVLVYLFTNSQQLRIMKIQLKEMEMTRNSQIQPLPYLEEPHAKMDLIRNYIDPTKPDEMFLMSRFFFQFTVKNLGNGPAVSVDFIPKLYTNQIFSNEESKFLIDTIGERIECISLREGDSKKISFFFWDKNHSVIESLLRRYMIGPTLLKCTIVFKNSLGMAFKEEIGFVLNTQSDEDYEQIKTSVKTSKTIDIDFGDRMKKYNELKLQGHEIKADQIFSEIRDELNKKFSGKEKIKLSINIKLGSFSVNPISEKEYMTIISKQNETNNRIIGNEVVLR